MQKIIFSLSNIEHFQTKNNNSRSALYVMHAYCMHTASICMRTALGMRYKVTFKIHIYIYIRTHKYLLVCEAAGAIHFMTFPNVLRKM